MDTEVIGEVNGSAAGPSAAPAETPDRGAREAEATPPSGSVKGITNGLITLAASLLCKRGDKTPGTSQGTGIAASETEDDDDGGNASPDDSGQDEARASRDEEGDEAADAELVEAAETLLASARAAPRYDVPKVKRKRGRPPKHKPQSALTEEEKAALRGASAGTPKRKPGRPPKQKKIMKAATEALGDAAETNLPSNGQTAVAAAAGEKRKRGRPPKNKLLRAMAQEREAAAGGEDGGAGGGTTVGKEEDAPLENPLSISKGAVSGAPTDSHKRKRGRPPRKSLLGGTAFPGPGDTPADDVDGTAGDVDDGVAATDATTIVKRKRGRPRKQKPQLAAQETLRAATVKGAEDGLLPSALPEAQAEVFVLKGEHDRTLKKEKEPKSEGKGIAVESQVAEAALGHEKETISQPPGATHADRAEVKRKRGRKPKHKQQVEERAKAEEEEANGGKYLSIAFPASVTTSGEKRKRDRLPMEKSQQAGTSSAGPQEGLQTGKAGEVDGTAGDVDDDVAATDATTIVKRKRGRPRKQKPQLAAQETFRAMVAPEPKEGEEAARFDEALAKRQEGWLPNHRRQLTTGATSGGSADPEPAGELLDADADNDGAQENVPKRKRGRPRKRSHAEPVGELLGADGDNDGAQENVPKRKRGRPRKRSYAEPVGELLGADADNDGAQEDVPKRKRGRPRKRSHAEPAGELLGADADNDGAQENVPKRKRGRPRKRSYAEPVGELLGADADNDGAQEDVPKRKRGRPRKRSHAEPVGELLGADADNDGAQEDVPKRKRGRPRKRSHAEPVGELLGGDADNDGAQEDVPKRKRGRPRKRSHAEPAGELLGADADNDGTQEDVPKRKRGRPPKRKSLLVVTDSASETEDVLDEVDGDGPSN
ncbi:hypothetical protein Vafri_9419 [Volvox africanus]|uniref:Uncharacterized protein n=1 Tax=Volvox africanus TaxID=51714 RepID=A0A8J4B4B5_9CHLO|nr:hypothetical protein Vafri_9419 [Volvox africanus]